MKKLKPTSRSKKYSLRMLYQWKKKIKALLHLRGQAHGFDCALLNARIAQLTQYRSKLGQWVRNNPRHTTQEAETAMSAMLIPHTLHEMGVERDRLAVHIFENQAEIAQESQQQLEQLQAAWALPEKHPDFADLPEDNASEAVRRELIQWIELLKEDEEMRLIEPGSLEQMEARLRRVESKLGKNAK